MPVTVALHWLIPTLPPQLVIVTGLPTSGKSTRAKQLHEYLTDKIQSQPSASQYRLHLVSDQTQSISRTVYDLSPNSLPAHTRSANASEKDARAALSSAVKRVLSTKDIVILDGLNYIKGWRYQLYTEAKNLSTPNVLLQIGCAVDKAKDVNEERLRQREERLAAGEDVSGDDEATEGAYESGNWENLVFRYEEPNPMSRWDSPLFTLIWDDGEAQTRKVFDDIWEVIAGQGRKIIKPNQAAIQRSRDAGGDYLYVLDKETQDIVKSILDQQSEEGGGEINISRGGDAAQEALVVELPSRKVGLPQLQRYRRAFMNMNRGGIGLEAVGNMAAARMRESFVGYLNDAFEKDD